MSPPIEGRGERDRAPEKSWFGSRRRTSSKSCLRDRQLHHRVPAGVRRFWCRCTSGHLRCRVGPVEPAHGQGRDDRLYGRHAQQPRQLRLCLAQCGRSDPAWPGHRHLRRPERHRDHSGGQGGQHHVHGCPVAAYRQLDFHAAGRHGIAGCDAGPGQRLVCRARRAFRDCHTRQWRSALRPPGQLLPRRWKNEGVLRQ